MSDCTGDRDCAAPVHIHGCYADRLPAMCDDPKWHDLIVRPPRGDRP